MSNLIFIPLATAFAIGLLLLIALTLACTAIALADDCVLFSKVQGKVVCSDAPAIGVRLVRQMGCTWSGEKIMDEATTDDQGEFTFPRVVRRPGVRAIWMHKPAINQRITIFHGEQAIAAWVLDKANYDDNGERQGRPIQLLCPLDETPDHQGPHWGIAQCIEAPQKKAQA